MIYEMSSLENTIVLYVHNSFHKAWKANVNRDAYDIQYVMSVLKKLFLYTVVFLLFKNKNSHSIRIHLNQSKDVESCHILKDQWRKNLTVTIPILCQLNIF